MQLDHEHSALSYSEGSSMKTRSKRDFELALRHTTAESASAKSYSHVRYTIGRHAAASAWCLRHLLLLVALGALSAPLQAATLTVSRGEVFADLQGSGYVPVQGSIELSAGATVLANPGAEAAIRYEDGCIKSVVPGSVMSIEAQSPCLIEGVSSDGPI